MSTLPILVPFYQLANIRLLRRLRVVFLFCLLPGMAALAQTVTGRVLSRDDSQPLPGVSIVVKGTTTGTTTGNDGTYTINLTNAANRTLTFSFIGYETQEVAVGNRSTIDVELAARSTTLSEVVVTALGIKKDIRTTGQSLSRRWMRPT